MDFTGKIINNCYIIREKIQEDDLISIWMVHALFSANQFIISFLKKKDKEINQNNLNLYKKNIRSLFYLNNDNILNIYELEEYNDYTYVVLEYLNVINLNNFLNSIDQLKPEYVLKILLQISKGVDTLHKKKMTHGNLIIDNVWIRPIYNNTDYIVKIGNIGKNLIKEILYDQVKAVKEDITNIGKIYNLMLTKQIDFNESIFNKILEKNDNKNNYIEFGKKLKTGFFKTAEEIIAEISFIKNNENSGNVKTSHQNNLKNLNLKDKEIDASSIERIKYFETLEMERTKKNKKDKNEYIDVYNYKKPGKSDFKANYYYEKIFDERKKYFDELIDETKVYFNNLRDYKKNKKEEVVFSYFDSLSKSTKKYSERLIYAEAKALNSIVNDNIDKLRTYNVDNFLKDSSIYFDNIIKESKNYYTNITDDSKKYFEKIFDYDKKNAGNKNSKGINDLINEKVINTLDFFNKINEKVNEERSSIKETLLNQLKLKENNEISYKPEKAKNIKENNIKNKIDYNNDFKNYFDNNLYNKNQNVFTQKDIDINKEQGKNLDNRINKIIKEKKTSYNKQKTKLKTHKNNKKASLIHQIDVMNLYDVIEYKKALKKGKLFFNISNFIKFIFMLCVNALTGKSSLIILRKKIKDLKIYKILHKVFSMQRGLVLFYDCPSKENLGVVKKILNLIYAKYSSGNIKYKEYIDTKLKKSFDFNIIKKFIKTDLNNIKINIDTDTFEKNINEKNKIVLLGNFITKITSKKYPLLLMLNNYSKIDEKSNLFVMELVKKINSGNIVLLLADKNFLKDLSFYIET